MNLYIRYRIYERINFTRLNLYHCARPIGVHNSLNCQMLNQGNLRRVDFVIAIKVT